MIIGGDDAGWIDRPKLTLDAVVKNDMIGLNLSQHLALDRIQWCKRIHVVDPN